VAGDAGPTPQPWADPGWAAQAGAWLATEMERLGRPVTGPPEKVHAWELAAPLGALHQAVSYRSIAAQLRPPVDPHLAQSTAWWLRRVLAGLAPSGA
jgi:hypothetical protein